MKRIFFTTALATMASYAFAMAGIAERWLEGWVNDLFCTLTVAVIQLILICVLFVVRINMKQIRYNKVFNKMVANEPASIAAGGLLLSVAISTYVSCFCGAFFIFGIFILGMLWILDWLCVLVSTWRKKIINAKNIQYICILSIGAIIGIGLYMCVVKYNWLTSLYSYSYVDGSMPDDAFVIHPTMYSPIINCVRCAFLLYFPWLICAIIQGLRSNRAKSRVLKEKDS